MPRVRNAHTSKTDSTSTSGERPEYCPQRYRGDDAACKDVCYNQVSRNPWPTPSPSPPPPVHLLALAFESNTSLPTLDSIPQSLRHKRKSASKRFSPCSSSSSCSSGFPRIPRPRNAFVLYRSWALSYHPALSSTQNKQDELSRMAGALWNSESDEVRAHFQGLAREEKGRHVMTYPGYSYTRMKGYGSAVSEYAEAGKEWRGSGKDRGVKRTRKYADDDDEYIPEAASGRSNARKSKPRLSLDLDLLPTPEPTPSPILPVALPSSSEECTVMSQPYWDLVEETFQKETGDLLPTQRPSIFSNTYPLPSELPAFSLDPSELSQATELSDMIPECLFSSSHTGPDIAAMFIPPDELSSMLNDILQLEDLLSSLAVDEGKIGLPHSPHRSLANAAHEGSLVRLDRSSGTMDMRAEDHMFHQMMEMYVDL